MANAEYEAFADEIAGAVFRSQHLDQADNIPPEPPRLYDPEDLELARRLADDGVLILNPLNLNPETIYDIDVDWWRALMAHRSRVYWRVAQHEKDRRAAEAAAREKG